ncbi:hypothetical protein [Haloarcula nitratireducens]|uniref:Uncharacterized protein n=1 Tax=Haloarcula nitratireducens TaxID=2487749 RepID=A0AAW4PG62_9EURY|nr:hypothetical protein [Halomicroarcula nitratireducens]MBX0297000.1 hypothetical protein [Halomicroarcula nitratireducens]
MAKTRNNCPVSKKYDRFSNVIAQGYEKQSVASKEERKQRVLEFMEETRLALPKRALYRNLAYRGVDFGEGSLKNYLGELREEGLIERIDAENYENGNLVISDEDPGYWVITGEGVKVAQGNTTSGKSDIDGSHL